MPHVWEVADRIHIQRLGGCAGVITPQSHDMGEGVAVMTGALESNMTEEEMSRPTPSRRALAALGHVVDSPMTRQQPGA